MNVGPGKPSNCIYQANFKVENVIHEVSLFFYVYVFVLRSPLFTLFDRSKCCERNLLNNQNICAALVSIASVFNMNLM